MTKLLTAIFAISDSYKFKFCIKSKLVFLYDFDRCYSKKIGDNPVLTLYDVFAQYNEIINNKDALKFLCSIYKYTQNQVYLNCITQNETKLSKLISLYNHDKKCNFQLEKEVPVDKDFYSNYNDIETIVDEFGKFLPKIEDSSKLKKQHIYVCDKIHFDSKGNINKKLYEEDRNQIVSNILKNIKSVLLVRKSQESI